jgi:hypothetical protein
MTISPAKSALDSLVKALWLAIGDTLTPEQLESIVAMFPISTFPHLPARDQTTDDANGILNCSATQITRKLNT